MAKSTKSTKKPSVPEQPYLIANPPWDPNSWAIYLPAKQVWSSQEKTPEALVEIYGGVPTNLKELTGRGHFKDGLPKKRTGKDKDVEGNGPEVTDKDYEIPL